jgi:hypothetical protein
MPKKKSDQSQVVLYQTPDGKVTVNVMFARDNFWLTQRTLADLFGVNIPAVNKHLKNIFESGELVENSVISILEITAADGKNYLTHFYNLDAVLAVGYRVNSVKATHFRIWATHTLRDYIVKGFVVNDQLLKNGREFGKDYFDELLEKIREIRASERRAYQKIADVFERVSALKNAPPARKNGIGHFFAKTLSSRFSFQLSSFRFQVSSFSPHGYRPIYLSTACVRERTCSFS